jgi:hypothetical protein
VRLVDLGELQVVLRRQSGVVARRQLLTLGGTDNDLRRLVRRRELRRVLAGVFVDHNGPLLWDQRAWAAVLACAPAALAGQSARRAHSLPGYGSRDHDPIDLVVPGERRVTAPSGVRVARSSTFEIDVQPHLSPPRQRLEVAVIRVATNASTPDAAVALLADAVQAGRTTVSRLRTVLGSRPPRASTALLAEVLDDVASGAYSALERRYLRDVERAHGLPHAHRQRRVRVGRAVHYRDVEYLGLRTLVELDGRLGHEWNADRWADLERDLQNAAAGDLTLRAGWRQVLDPCRLAGLVGRVLLARGWRDAIRACRPGCGAPLGGFQSPGDCNPPATGSA